MNRASGFELTFHLSFTHFIQYRIEFCVKQSRIFFFCRNNFEDEIPKCRKCTSSCTLRTQLLDEISNRKRIKQCDEPCFHLITRTLFRSSHSAKTAHYCSQTKPLFLTKLHSAAIDELLPLLNTMELLMWASIRTGEFRKRRRESSHQHDPGFGLLSSRQHRCD